MGSSVPWFDGRRERLLYRDVPAVAAVCALPAELTQQHAFDEYIFSAASWFEPETGLALLNRNRLPLSPDQTSAESWVTPALYRTRIAHQVLLQEAA
jgi:hypothetical protein